MLDPETGAPQTAHTTNPVPVYLIADGLEQGQLARELDETEVAGQMNRARVISAFVSVLFSFLYNLQTLGMPGRE